MQCQLREGVFESVSLKPIGERPGYIHKIQKIALLLSLHDYQASHYVNDQSKKNYFQLFGDRRLYVKSGISEIF